jgi:transposase
VVYEACGFGFGLYRELEALGVHCYVIAPRKLDEQFTRVKTDPRDATTLCQRLSRYLEGNTRELAVIRVPTEAEEQARHVSRQREQLVRHRQKLEAQGRSLLINHSLALTGSLVEKSDLVALKQIASGLDLCSSESSSPGLVDPGATDQRFECGVGSSRSSRCSRRRG